MEMQFQPIDPSVTTESLTTARLEGTGTFDVLMRAFKGHIQEEFSKNRITGANYSEVYLGGLQSVMSTALQLTMQQRSVTLENSLKEEQLVLAEIQQRAAEAGILQTTAQTELIQQQRTNLIDELLTNAKQREKMDAEIENLKLQKDILAAQIIEMQQRGEMIKQQILNLKDELLTSIEQRKKVIQEVINLAAQLPLIEAQVREMDGRATLVAGQIRKIDAEIVTETFNRNKISAEIDLLGQKKFTEIAQVDANSVAANSVLGKQIALYGAQADGFKRDSEQKAAQIMVDTWKIRRTTDEATVADGTNALYDQNIGRAVITMLQNAGVTGV